MLFCKEIRKDEIVFVLGGYKSLIIPKNKEYTMDYVINRLVYELSEELDNEECWIIKEFNNG